MDSQPDFLLALTGSSFSLNPAPEKEFGNLMEELFAHPEPMDIEKEFANDGESIEETHQDPCQQLPDQLQQQQQKCLQVTQHPQSLREGITKESEPVLPREVQMTQVPSLSIFRRVKPPPSQMPPVEEQLPELEVEDIDELLLSPLSETPVGSQLDDAVPPTPASAAASDQLLVLHIGEPGEAQERAVEVELSPPLQSTLEEAELDRKVQFIRDVVKRYHSRGAPACCNGKLQVHEVVLVLLLAPPDSGLTGVLVFCTQDGRETSRPSGNFKANDTKTMGLIWKKVKNNRNANYDTFARAMRVGRERSKEYFEYLDAGKGAKKRVYKLGPKSLKELERMAQVLKV